jgi:TniQ.
MKSCLVCTTSFTAFLPLPLVLSCVSHQCEEYWTLRTGIIWKACQLAISMNSSEPEVIGVHAYARTALIGQTVRLPASLSVCWWLVHFIPAPTFHAVLKFPTSSVGYLLLHEVRSVWTREGVVKHSSFAFW